MLLKGDKDGKFNTQVATSVFLTQNQHPFEAQDLELLILMQHNLTHHEEFKGYKTHKKHERYHYLEEQQDEAKRTRQQCTEEQDQCRSSQAHPSWLSQLPVTVHDVSLLPQRPQRHHH